MPVTDDRPAAPPVASPRPPDPPGPPLRGVRFAVVAFLVVGVVLVLDVWWSTALLDIAASYQLPDTTFPGSGVLGGWYRFDGGWYRLIAVDGYYSLGPGAQSPVAFFPAYPLAVRAVAVVVRDPVLAGMAVTAASGLALAVLLYRWAADKVGTGTARLAVVLLLLYPYAYYLFGAVYADAFFLAATVGAFVLLERGHPVLAGLAGVAATAARPVGVAVVVGLVAVSIYRHRRDGTPWRPADAGVLLSVAGLGAWCTYLWVRFGDPFLFQAVQAAPGWDQGEGPRTWFKETFFQRLPRLPFWLSDVAAGSTTHNDSPWIQSTYTLGLVLQATMLVAALVLVPLVFKRFGWGYGAYVLVVLAIPLVGSKDFQGVGRYVLAAFPCFVVAAQLLGRHRVARWAWLPVSAALLLLLTSGYARGYYIA